MPTPSTERDGVRGTARVHARSLSLGHSQAFEFSALQLRLEIFVLLAGKMQLSLKPYQLTLGNLSQENRQLYFSP
jgi:hypothetical protein